MAGRAVVFGEARQGPEANVTGPFPQVVPPLCPAFRRAPRRPRLPPPSVSILGKGGKVRQVLLPDIVSRSLLSLRGDAGANDPVFGSRKGGHLTERAVNGMVKRTARKAGINEAVSPHWLRHAHGSHAIDRGASLPEVQSTLGHGNIATTSGYLHARPNTSSGLHLDPGVLSSMKSRARESASDADRSPPCGRFTR
jgi:integrase-like protein